ncbi:hypothetical protein [Methanolacinia paynteri]|uniref:hypothetical protein n=1 Tax=Methanolacinia paynteri TaxID=230356 RepID=UPI00064F2DF1|nr:hypothetical protein [Methanolacinia paynteri]
MNKFTNYISTDLRNNFIFRIVLTALLLIAFMTVSSVLVTGFGIYNADLNLVIFVAPILIVYLGTGGTGLFDEEKLSETEDSFVSFRYKVFIASFIVPFIIFWLIVPMIQIMVTAISPDKITGTITAAFSASIGMHFIPAVALGVAGLGGILKRTSMMVSVVCLALSPFIFLMNTYGSL